MQFVNLNLILVASITVIFGLNATSFAFHSGGVADCEGCHSMHNSFEGSPNVTGRTFAQGTGMYLLKANDQSSACLNCHHAADTAPNSYHISTNGINPYDSTTPVEMTPGGDFAWLKKTMNVVIRGTTALDGNLGKRHGHNIVAADFGYVADNTLSVAPGGSYPAAQLHCSSCHDPHGKYRRFADGTFATSGLPIFNSGTDKDSANPTAGISTVGAYRLLGGIGYQPKSLSGSYAFSNTVPDVIAPVDYNRPEKQQPYQQTHVAYGRNMSEWCANCHAGMLQGSYTSGMTGLRHPAGNNAKFTAAIVTNYNTYVSSGIMTNTDVNKTYSTLAPFEVGTGDYNELKSLASNNDNYKSKNNGNNNGNPSATTSNNVMCLSCHRAHATAFASILRWNYSESEFMTAADSSGAAIYDTVNGMGTGYSQTQQQTAYYSRPATFFGPNARSYCNKCHAKD